jgi:hypothetical protein
VSSITDDATAAGFASQSDALSSDPITIPAENMLEALSITQAMGSQEPNAFALAAYHAVQIVEKASQIDIGATKVAVTVVIAKKIDRFFVSS